MNKGTVIYIGGFELPDRNAAAHRVLSNAKILREIGYNVVFIDIDKELEFNFKNTKKKLIHGFECWSIAYPKSSMQWISYLTSIKYFKSINEKYKNISMVIAYNYPAICLSKMKKYCKFKNIKLIADCTEWYDGKGNGCLFRIIKSIDSNLRMRFIQPKLDGVIVISEYLERYYKKKRVEKISKLPPLVDKSEKKWEKNYNINSNNEKIRLVYAGSPDIDKDKLNFIIEAINEVENNYCVFNIIGITKIDYLKSFPNHRDLLKKLGNKIEFLGRLSHFDALESVKYADFVIFTRNINRVTTAGFPTKFVESISCCTPVITNDYSDIKLFLKNGENGFLLEKDFKEEIKFILSRNIYDLKNIKKNMDNDLFDYRKYKDELKKIL